MRSRNKMEREEVKPILPLIVMGNTLQADREVTVKEEDYSAC